MPQRCLPLVLVSLAVGCADIDVIADVSYDDRFGSATSMDVYLPNEGNGGALLLVHGGGWRSFSKDVYRDHAARFASAGYVVAATNYRLVPSGAFPAAVHDVMCALAFFQAQGEDLGFERSRVGVAGYSAGGHLSSLLGVATAVPSLQPDCEAGLPLPPAAVVSGAGPQDMRLLRPVDSVTEFLGGTADEVPSNYTAASPITHVHAEAPPFLFVHGTGDIFVGIEHSRKMRDALSEVGVQTRILELAGGGHILNQGIDVGHAQLVVAATDTPEAWSVTLDFLDRHLGSP